MKVLKKSGKRKGEMVKGAEGRHRSKRTTQLEQRSQQGTAQREKERFLRQKEAITCLKSHVNDEQGT